MAADAQIFRLRDGRALAYAEQGDPDGLPLLVAHGLPGSRLSRHPDGSIASRHGVRVLSFDRPGIGLSTPQRRRRILDWPRDVEEFADATGLERFAVLGWSGGGAYALATARELPERVSRVALVASVVPLAGTAFRRSLSADLRRKVIAGRLLPWLANGIAAAEAAAFARDPERTLERGFARGPECDRVVLDDPALREMLISSRREAYRQGPRRLAADALLYIRPWGFQPAEVGTPVTLWHGEQDETLGVSMGRFLAEALPSCEPRFLPEEGHMICLTRWEEILSELAS